MTISAGGEHLAIPVGYTEKITLDKIIEIEEGDDLQLVDGEYHLLKADEMAGTETEVATVTVDPSTNNIDAIKVYDSNQPSSYNTEHTVNDVESQGEINIKAKKIDKAVIEIGALTAEQPTELVLNFTIDAQGVNYDAVQIKKMEITFPDFIKFKEGQTGLVNNKLTIEDAEIDETIGYVPTPLKIIGYEFGSRYGEGIAVEGENNEKFININNEFIKVVTTVTVTNISGIGTLNIKPTAILNEMTVNKVFGTIKPDMNVETTNVELTNLPDFLQDDEVKLDITNPIFSFKANNPLQTNIEMDGVMTGYKNGQVTKVVKIGSGNGGNPIILKPSGDNQQTISLTRVATAIEGATNVVVPNLNDIIETIPDYITVDLEPTVKSDDYYNVELGQKYILNSSYDIDVPLNFGSNLKIVYDETIDNFDLDLEDVDIKKAILSINAVNTIPLAMEIKNENVSALDANGNVIKDIDVTVEGTITESKDGKAEVSSTLNINLNETAEGAISKLDGLKLKVTAVPGQATDVQLLSTQWLQLTDMKLKIPNGIKVDLN
ncbi:hypothetical protein DWW16_16910 [Bacteroides clarus]|uniref:Uncharacterized protein n=2 Tax=Bacteroides clarus TaxID=626929 RepID=A0A412XVK3_9BACE|nr:hypothetical protein DWW16_16910 [Bacteroides clarus]RGV49226.1 hypothetical protein DWW09_16305 [Bacteroides clarus]